MCCWLFRLMQHDLAGLVDFSHAELADLVSSTDTSLEMQIAHACVSWDATLVSCDYISSPQDKDPAFMAPPQSCCFVLLSCIEMPNFKISRTTSVLRFATIRLMYCMWKRPSRHSRTMSVLLHLVRSCATYLLASLQLLFQDSSDEVLSARSIDESAVDSSALHCRWFSM